MGAGEGFVIGEAGAAFPMLHQLVEAEAGGGRGSAGLPGERGREGEDDRFLAVIFELGLAREGTPPRAAQWPPAASRRDRYATAARRP
jgi:hypothetical protein